MMLGLAPRFIRCLTFFVLLIECLSNKAPSSPQTVQNSSPSQCANSNDNNINNKDFVWSSEKKLSASEYSISTLDKLEYHVLSERIAEIGFTQTIELLSDIPLHSSQSLYQTIEVFESKFFGKVLVLDGVLQITERDGSAYNEMMAFIPMMAHRRPKKVLVIGGGDGYVVHEVLKHEEVELIDHVDLDEEVVRVCQKYFPWANVWANKKVKLHIDDGAAFVRRIPDNYYDVVIQDSSDPHTADEDGVEELLPSSVLYSLDHFRHVKRILRRGGVYMLQAESYTIPTDLKGIKSWRQQGLDVGFHSVRYGSISISTYPTGQIGFLLCELSDVKDFTNETQLIETVKDRFSKIDDTSYYHPILQVS